MWGGGGAEEERVVFPFQGGKNCQVGKLDRGLESGAGPTGHHGLSSDSLPPIFGSLVMFPEWLLFSLLCWVSSLACAHHLLRWSPCRSGDLNSLRRISCSYTSLSHLGCWCMYCILSGQKNNHQKNGNNMLNFKTIRTRNRLRKNKQNIQQSQKKEEEES